MSVQRLALGVFLIAALLGGGATAAAQAGVGVNIIQISVDERLSPGGRYRLSPIGVINTGSTRSDYEVIISYFQNQKELRPPEEWFGISPSRFTLEAGEVRSVSVTISLPLRARPGQYFALIEAHPVSSETGVGIGVAAATKLDFKVRPANILFAVYYRTLAIFETYTPGSYIGLGGLGVALLYLLFTRVLRIRIRFERGR